MSVKSFVFSSTFNMVALVSTKVKCCFSLITERKCRSFSGEEYQLELHARSVSKPCNVTMYHYTSVKKIKPSALV